MCKLMSRFLSFSHVFLNNLTSFHVAKHKIIVKPTKFDKVYQMKIEAVKMRFKMRAQASRSDDDHDLP